MELSTALKTANIAIRRNRCKYVPAHDVIQGIRGKAVMLKEVLLLHIRPQREILARTTHEDNPMPVYNPLAEVQKQAEKMVQARKMIVQPGLGPDPAVQAQQLRNAAQARNGVLARFSSPFDQLGLGNAAVWVNPNSEIYHREECSCVCSTAEVRRLAEVHQTHRACRRCNPPQLKAPS